MQGPTANGLALAEYRLNSYVSTVNIWMLLMMYNMGRQRCMICEHHANSPVDILKRLSCRYHKTVVVQSKGYKCALNI